MAPTGGSGVTASGVAVATGVLPITELLMRSRATMIVGVALAAVCGPLMPLANNSPTLRPAAANTPIAKKPTHFQSSCDLGSPARQACGLPGGRRREGTSVGTRLR